MRTRTAEECRKQALEVLKLNITPKESKTADVSADVVDALRKTKVSCYFNRNGYLDVHIMKYLQAVSLTIYLT